MRTVPLMVERQMGHLLRGAVYSRRWCWRSGHVGAHSAPDGRATDGALAEGWRTCGAADEMSTGHKHHTDLLVHAYLARPLLLQLPVLLDQ